MLKVFADSQNQVWAGWICARCALAPALFFAARFALKKPSMTREDLADFMIANLDKAEWVGKSPLIGY